MKRLEKGLIQGKAFAGERFITYWEQKLNCVLRNLKPGGKRGEIGLRPLLLFGFVHDLRGLYLSIFPL